MYTLPTEIRTKIINIVLDMNLSSIATLTRVDKRFHCYVDSIWVDRVLKGMNVIDPTRPTIQDAREWLTTHHNYNAPHTANEIIWPSIRHITLAFNIYTISPAYIDVRDDVRRVEMVFKYKTLIWYANPDGSNTYKLWMRRDTTSVVTRKIDRQLIDDEARAIINMLSALLPQIAQYYTV